MSTIDALLEEQRIRRDNVRNLLHRMASEAVVAAADLTLDHPHPRQRCAGVARAATALPEALELLEAASFAVATHATASRGAG